MSDNSKKPKQAPKPATAKQTAKRPILSAEIADAIRDAIVTGQLIVDERLPSEAELSAQFNVSRPTVREALKRLAAQSLIRTQRGASGGAFVNRLSYEQAYDQQVTTATLLLSMNGVGFETACDARFALERACAPLAARNRTQQHLDRMRSELDKQRNPALTDEAFCTSDVAFHRAFVDSACNQVLSYQLAGAIEAMQPLMNMITYTRRSREKIVDLHNRILTALDQGDIAECDVVLAALHGYTVDLGKSGR